MMTKLMTYHQPKIYLDSACWGVKIFFQKLLDSELADSTGESGIPLWYSKFVRCSLQLEDDLFRDVTKRWSKTPPKWWFDKENHTSKLPRSLGGWPSSCFSRLTTQDSFGLRVFRDMDMEKALEEWNLVQAGRNLTTSWQQSCEDWRNFYANFWEFQWNGGRQWIHGLSFCKVLKISNSNWNCQKRWNE